MKNFRSLSKEEYDKVWNNFYELFDFSPSTTVFPALTTTMPQLKLDISRGFGPAYPLNELEQFALTLFNNITKPGDRLYALDWQHECFDFDSRQEMNRNEFEEWIIPIFPNGDYYIFMTKDFNNVWFGHPWEETITLIGENIVKEGRQKIEDFEKLRLKVL